MLLLYQENKPEKDAYSQILRMKNKYKWNVVSPPPNIQLHLCLFIF